MTVEPAQRHHVLTARDCTGIFLCITGATMYMMLSNFAAGRPPSRLVLCYTFLLTCGATVFTGTNVSYLSLPLRCPSPHFTVEVG